MKATRPISQRDLTTRSPGEIGRRLVFVAYVLATPVGSIALALGLARHRTAWTDTGGVALLLFTVLHLTRKRWGAHAITEDLRTNLPFKPTRMPKDSDK